MLRALVLVTLMLGLATAGASEPEPEAESQCSTGRFGAVHCIRPAEAATDICRALEGFARHNGIDPGFFARLIWQESRFDPNAQSPAQAQGIAQFIPSTAELRGLANPWNPAEALEFSAQYLGELTRRYGNPGLAAVAYNGGEARAEGFVSGRSWLASETVAYVFKITGLPAEIWRDEPPETHDFRLQPDKPFAEACQTLAEKRRLSPYPDRAPKHPWGVQLAYGTTRDRALAQFQMRSKRCAAVLASETPDLVWEKSRASPQGGYYMARIGRETRDAGWRLCSELKAEGCLCAVYRNR